MKTPLENSTTQQVGSLSDNLAVRRTELAEQRTVMASERTFSAWVRTGLAAVAAGVGVGRLLDFGAVEWLAKIVSAILILTGAGIYVIAFMHYREETRRLKRTSSAITPPWVQWLLGAALLLSALLALVLVF